MRKLYKGEKDNRRILNGTKRIKQSRIEEINLDRRLSASAAELEGRHIQQAKNDSITMFSED